MNQHFDVLIVGAGISGIGCAHHLREQHPQKTFLVLEAHETFGGTWLIHRYPGIRSDSDLYTFGYRFKPWIGAPIATGAEIMRYLGEVIAESGLSDAIQYGRRVLAASWSSRDARWSVEVETVATGAVSTLTANILWMCSGYYRHDAGYRPDWPGLDTFAGTLVHPQAWPENIDLDGKRVVVIGSGATAATLVPALAGRCRSLTMLQRSPTYFYIGANQNELADTLRSLDIDPSWIHEIVRRKLLQDQKALTALALAHPDLAKAHLIQAVRDQLGPDFDVETHFTPRYRPWEQRIAFSPGGDLFQAIRNGQADIVTDTIESFERDGVRLHSGRFLEADVVVTATGFQLAVLGDMKLSVDGAPVDIASEVTWRGLMLSGAPNLFWTFGYFRASWTLRVDLVADLVCRVMRRMDDVGARSVTPQISASERAEARSWSEGADFSPGYMQRGEHLLPRRGPAPEWVHTQDYWAERDDLPSLDLEQTALVFR